MPDIILPNLGLELPDVGSDQDTWGDILNANLEILDNAVTYDAITKTLGAVDVTLTTAEAAHGVINLNGTLTANVNLIVPVSPVRLYLVNNGTTGAFTVAVKTAAGSGVTVNQGANTLVYSDGTNIVQGATSVNGSFAAGTVNAGTLNVSGAASFAAGTAALPSITRAGDLNTGLYFPAADTVGISTAGVLRLTVDSAGNAGLGVTPSAWLSSFKAFDINDRAAISGASGGAIIWANAFIDASSVERYKQSAFAVKYVAASDIGAHIWQTAPSGTAGNPITFTQAMTLEQSGRLLVPQNYISSSGWQSNGTTFTSAAAIFNGVYGAADNIIAVATLGTERARITSGGYFKASNTGTYGGVAGLPSLSGSSNHIFQSDQNSTVVAGLSSSTGSDVCLFNSFLPTSAAGTHFKGNLNAVTVYQVLANGNVQNTNNSYGPISDAKLKENVQDAPSFLDRFMQLRFVTYNLKESLGYNPEKQLGWIAQEVEQIFPSLVYDNIDTEQVTKTRIVEVPAVLDEEGNEVTPATTREEEYTESVPTGTVTKALKASIISVIQGKVIQELNAKVDEQQAIIQAQQAQIDSILTRLAALEAK